MSVVMCQAVFWEIVEVNKTGKIMDSHGTYLSGVIAETDKKKEFTVLLGEIIVF